MHPYLILLAWLGCVITPSVGGELPDLGTLCPYNDFCTQKATKTLKPNETDLMPCCQKCSCEPDCQLFGNCCPDKELKPDVQVKYPCIRIDQYFNKPRNIRVFQAYDLYYHVINDCPTRNLLAEYPRCSKLQDLEDYVFVSDPLTGRVYQNQHCAICNGVMKYTKWYLSTDCSDGSNDMTWEEWSTYIMTSCDMTPIPPDYHSGYESSCYRSKRKDIHECNYTGEWETIDTDIQTACEFENPAINDKYYHDVIDIGLLTFRNPFCKLCNTNEDEEWSHLCKQLLPGSKGSKGVSLNPISVLINVFSEEETVMESSPQCNLTELWDPFTVSYQFALE
ncbi:hypothetical protein ACF0H5_015586 [Mactra antiquata]